MSQRHRGLKRCVGSSGVGRRKRKSPRIRGKSGVAGQDLDAGHIGRRVRGRGLFGATLGGDGLDFQCGDGQGCVAGAGMVFWQGEMAGVWRYSAGCSPHQVSDPKT